MLLLEDVDLLLLLDDMDLLLGAVALLFPPLPLKVGIKEACLPPVQPFY
jgi:hypothetical protein